MRTIPRTHTRKITGLKATLTACAVFTRPDDPGQAGEPDAAWAAFDGGHATLADNGDGTYTIRATHGGWWWRLAVSDNPVTITRDGKPIVTVDGSNAAFRWLLRHQPQSVEWAIRYEGYRVIGEDGRELPEFAEHAQR